MFVRSFASGSSGNCYLVTCQETGLLLDAGISCRSIVGALRLNGLQPDNVQGIFVTHEHADHVKGVQVFAKRSGGKVYASHKTWQAMQALGIEVPAAQKVGFTPGEALCLGSARIKTFSTHHDSADSVGFVVEDMVTSQRIGLVTDTGRTDAAIVEAISGCSLLIIESNHDPEMLVKGPYPDFLKRRILGGRGHLSNLAGAELAAQTVTEFTHSVWLAHLSHENNTPETALSAMRQVLERNLHGKNFFPEIVVVPREMQGPAFPEEPASLF